MTEAASEGTRQRRIKSIEVGFRIVRVLEAAVDFLPLVRIASTVGMPSSKVHIYLTSFIREGLVVQDPATGYYGLGPFSMQLGLAAIRNLDVVPASRDIVDRLRDATGCGVSLAVWGNRGPSLILKADGVGQGSLGMRLGHVFWPSTSASGRIFLTYLPEREVNEALRAESLIRPAKLDANELQAVIDGIRHRGFAVSERPSVNGRTAVAAPVFDYSGKPVASLAVLADEHYAESGVLAALIAAANEISERIGWRASAKVLS